MKRFLAGLAGLAVGIALTWACLYILNHANLPQPKATSDCDVEHCGPWWALPLALAAYLLPSVGFAVAGYLAQARAWSMKKAAVVFGALILCTLFFLARPYIVIGPR
jgi:hypothetical protein